MGVAVLTSGVTLGTYVPGLLLCAELRRQGVLAGVDVLEALLVPAELAKTAARQDFMRRNLRTAVATQRRMVKQDEHFCDKAVAELLQRWRETNVDVVVVLAGGWAPIVHRYVDEATTPVIVEVCHLDAGVMPSFRLYTDELAAFNRTSFLELSPPHVAWTIPVTNQPPISWWKRCAVVGHGGGWGIGDYRSQAMKLLACGFTVDLVAHREHDLVDAGPSLRWHLLDPTWSPWRDGGFPPLMSGLDSPHNVPAFGCHGMHHESFHLTRRSMAVLSKPGGGTLIDSLAAATPVIFLDAFGAHESANADCWQRLGFGMSLPAWAGTDFSTDVLYEMHRGLLEHRRHVPNYANHIQDELLTGRV